MPTQSKAAFQRERERRWRLKWECLRRNEEYRKDYREFARGLRRVNGQLLYHPTRRKGETKAAWRLRIDQTVGALRRKWAIAWPRDPKDTNAWVSAFFLTGVDPPVSILSTIAHTIGSARRPRKIYVPLPGNVYPVGLDERAGRYLYLRLDVTRSVEELLQRSRLPIEMARAALRQGRGGKQTRAPKLAVLEEALRVHDTAMQLPKGRRTPTEVAREMHPHLRGVTIDRAQTTTAEQRKLEAAAGRIKRQLAMASTYVNGAYRGI